MKVVKAIAILLIVPFLGLVVAVILGLLALPPDPNFVANGSHASPGDGFLLMFYIVASLVITVPLSVLLAGIVLFRKPKLQLPGDSGT